MEASWADVFPHDRAIHSVNLFSGANGFGTGKSPLNCGPEGFPIRFLERACLPDLPPSAVPCFRQLPAGHRFFQLRRLICCQNLISAVRCEGASHPSFPLSAPFSLQSFICLPIWSTPVAASPLTMPTATAVK